MFGIKPNEGNPVIRHLTVKHKYPESIGYHNDPSAYKYQVMGTVKGVETLRIIGYLRYRTLSTGLYTLL